VDPNDLTAGIGSGAPILPGPQPRPQGQPIDIPPSSSFRSVLEQTAATSGTPQTLKFSNHALQRLQSRNITLSDDDVARMNTMADKAAAKGAKQSLFIMRDTALVVSIKNRTVITAVDQDSMKDNVFTNIDSAAII